MKTKLVVVLLFTVSCFAQNPVDEAKNNIAAKKHKAMVAHAEELLERKADLERELAEVNEKLAKLAEGKDVKVSSTDNVLKTNDLGWVTASSISTGQ